MPTKPTRSIVGCCARTAGGHAAAAPPSSVMKSRRRIWIAMCPSRGRSCPCNGGTISRFERAVCDYFTLGSAPGADCKGGYQGHTLAQRPSHPSQPDATAVGVDFAERQLWNIGPDSGSGSLHLYVEGPDEFAPLLGFVGDELAKVSGRADKRRASEVSQPRLDFGICEARVDLLVEFLDDSTRRGLWCADAEPDARLVATHKLTYGRDV